MTILCELREEAAQSREKRQLRAMQTSAPGREPSMAVQLSSTASPQCRQPTLCRVQQCLASPQCRQPALCRVQRCLASPPCHSTSTTAGAPLYCANHSNLRQAPWADLP